MIDVCDDGHVADVLHIAFLNLAAKVQKSFQLSVFGCQFYYNMPQIIKNIL